MVQVFSWGDNEHGQQGNNSTISSRRPQPVASLKDHRITKIACGSSHSVAFTSGVLPSAMDFTPISFPTSHDPLGTALTSSRLIEDSHTYPEIKRPSLTRIILSLQTPLKQQEALAHVLTSLQIAYARDAIVNSLEGVATAAQKQSSVATEECLASPAADTTMARKSISSQNSLEMPDGGGHMPAGLDDFTSLLSVEDARVLVDLLKLAVANRVGEKGRETLGTVLTAMGKANQEVGPVRGRGGGEGGDGRKERVTLSTVLKANEEVGSVKGGGEGRKERETLGTVLTAMGKAKQEVGGGRRGPVC